MEGFYHVGGINWYIDNYRQKVYGIFMGSGFLRSIIRRKAMLISFSILFGWYMLYPTSAMGATSIDDFIARPPIHIKSSSMSAPSGLTPAQIKSAYNLPQSGGRGTIAIIGAYDDKEAEADLGVFSRQFGLPSCSISNGCFEIHKMAKSIKQDSPWAGETSLDTQWSHAIAPNAKILLVEAKSASGKDLLAGVDYARGRSDVVSVSMSWGGGEFAGEKNLDSHFQSSTAVFFASSGDNGAGVEWPAVSKNVIGVGGTSLHFNSLGKLISETAWSGSGGGISSYMVEPPFQLDLNIPGLGKKRAVPDVSYNGDPDSGFPIYHHGWSVVGGTSAGAPQWAAMRALGKNISLAKLYKDAASPRYPSYFRDIFKGANGDCGKDCSAGKRYDLVTGLGSPLTTLY